MKIYVIEDENKDYLNIFTSWRKAKKLLNSDDSLKMSIEEIPVTRQGIFYAIQQGAEIGGNEIGGEFD